MAIQFRCKSCSQPIEVDEDLARQEVMCPFCRATSIAPSESNLQSAAVEGGRQVSSETAVNGGFGQPARPAGEPDMESMPTSEDLTLTPGPPPERNTWAWVSLICAAATAISLSVLFVQFLSIGKELGTDDPKLMNERMQSEMKQRPAMAYISLCSVCVLPLFTVLFAIFAFVKKAPPRWPAAVALSLLMGWVLTMCIWSAISSYKLGKAGQTTTTSPSLPAPG